MEHTIRILPKNTTISAENGKKLLEILRQNGLAPDAPCGGQGKCGKCRVFVDGEEVLACQTTVNRDITLTLPEKAGLRVLDEGVSANASLNPQQEGDLLAFDIGTTSVVCFLLDGKTGRELGKSSMLNPQASFGGDVISRIQAALAGEMDALTAAIRDGMTELVHRVTDSPETVGVVSVVGNPAMQQLFLGISPQNLAGVPFAPVLTGAKTIPCQDILPVCPNARLLVVPDISGYVGADTMGCLLATGLYEKEELTLLVDIGTNGEIVLGNKDKMIACSTAAGPALEGASIQFGMRGTEGAIDHVWVENGEFCCSVIGNGEAKGICGSGLIDAVAAGLDLGLINRRGRVNTEDRCLHLTDSVYLTQEDIRQVQLAKGAIAAGIQLMAAQLGVQVGDIQSLLLAGAFGSFLEPKSACRIGLLPMELLEKIQAVGNAAGSGAKMLAKDAELLQLTEALTHRIRFLELASLPEFSMTFARAMGFR